MDNKKIPTHYGTIVILIIAVTVGVFVWKYEEKQPEIQQPQLTTNVKKPVITQTPIAEQQVQEKTENISFCGKTYKSDEIIINSNDIIQTIAQVSKNKNWICKNLELGKFQESGISIAQKKESDHSNSYLIVFFHKDNDKEVENPFNQSPFIFKFDFDNNQIFYQNQIDGKFKLLEVIK